MKIVSFINALVAMGQGTFGRWKRLWQTASYLRNGRKPWSMGYVYFKEDYIRRSINDTVIMDLFRRSRSLPGKYGEFLDERVVEFPWLLSRISNEGSRLLDAGSALNHPYILKHPSLHGKDITIVTLAPESYCAWKDRVSYLFGDLRDLPFRDGLFDEVVSISTIEHVGMNNALYTQDVKLWEHRKDDHFRAVAELRRVTKPGGKVYLTVPFGKYTDFGWYQQFDEGMIRALINAFAPSRSTETYYCYEQGGWTIGTGKHCRNFEGFNIHDTKYFNPKSSKDYDPDMAACSRAIAALELWK